MRDREKEIKKEMNVLKKKKRKRKRKMVKLTMLIDEKEGRV